MQGLRRLAGMALPDWRRVVLPCSGNGGEAHAGVIGGGMGRGRPTPRILMALLLLCCAGLVAAGNVGAESDESIEFGNNLADAAFNGVCNDPRFYYLDARGSAPKPSGENMFRDAADCREAVAEELVVPRDRIIPGMELGTDELKPDGRCKDPRFIVDPRRGGKEHSWHLAANEAERKDAQDCFNAWLAGEVWPLHRKYDKIAFGNDGGAWANDGACDDPRFEGEGRSGVTLRDHVLNDMTDCIEAYENASGPKGELFLTVVPDGHRIDFGDNSGSWSFDGECDDPRFDGEGMSEFPRGDHLKRDAIDCYRAFRDNGHNNDFVLLSEVVTTNFDFGNDSGSWPFDGECDDPRFEGNGVAAIARDEMGDATDCRRAYRAGDATWAGDAAIPR